MLDLTKFTATGKTFTLANGKSFDVYSKGTGMYAKFYYYTGRKMVAMSHNAQNVI